MQASARIDGPVSRNRLHVIKSKFSPSRIIIAAVALAVGVALSVPFYFARRGQNPGGDKERSLIKTHDLAQHLAVMKQFDKVVREGTLYPRWMPDFNKGYGNAWLNYYPPGLYYITFLFNLVLRDWVDTLFIITVLGFALSALTFYKLSRAFYGRPASGIAAIFYTALPFHVTNIYWQGAVPQFLGFVFLPMVLYFAFKVGFAGRARDYAGLGVFFSLYVVTHFPVAYLLAYAIALYALIWTVRERNFKILLRIAAGMILGLVLSGIYILPAALEKKYSAEIFTDIFKYHESYLTIKPIKEPFDEVMRWAFIAQTVALLVAIIILIAASWSKARRRDTDQQTGAMGSYGARPIMWAVMAVTTTFMITHYSIYISKLIPSIEVLWFAWRWLPIAGLFTALLVAAAIDRVRIGSDLKHLFLWPCRAVIGAAIVLSLGLTVRSAMMEAFTNPPFDPPDNYIAQTSAPAGSADPNTLADTPLAMLRPEGGAVEVVQWESEHREVLITTNEQRILRLKTYNFPGWTARIDGNPAPILSDLDYTQNISITPGNHRVEVSFETTPARSLGAMVSGIGLLLVLGLTLSGYLWKSKQSLMAEESSQKSDWRTLIYSRKAMIGAIGFIAVAVLFIAAIVANYPYTKSPPAPSTEGIPMLMNAGDSSGSEPASPPPPERRLFIEGERAIRVAVDDVGFDELMSAIISRDDGKVRGLIREGKVFTVRNDTRVLVLNTRSGKVRVKILEGSNEEKEGWVMERWIR